MHIRVDAMATGLAAQFLHFLLPSCIFDFHHNSLYSACLLCFVVLSATGCRRLLWADPARHMTGSSVGPEETVSASTATLLLYTSWTLARWLIFAVHRDSPNHSDTEKPNQSVCQLVPGQPALISHVS
jgi:hypothetical protein